MRRRPGAVQREWHLVDKSHVLPMALGSCWGVTHRISISVGPIWLEPSPSEPVLPQATLTLRSTFERVTIRRITETTFDSEFSDSGTAKTQVSLFPGIASGGIWVLLGTIQVLLQPPMHSSALDSCEGHIPVSREGKVSTASPKPQAVISCAKMGFGSLLLGRRPPCSCTASRDENGTEEEESMEGQVWTSCSRLKGEMPSFTVSLCAASHQQSSQNSRPQAGCKPWGRSQQGHLTCFQPSSPAEEQVRLNAKGYPVCLAFCALEA